MLQDGPYEQIISTIAQEIRDGFPDAPKGCYIQLEKMASRYILDNIRASYGDSGWLVTRIASFEEDTGIPLTLAGFLRHYRIDPRSIYKCATFSRLCARADIFVDFHEPMEDVFKKAMMRLCCADSRRFIAFLLDLLPRVGKLDAAGIAALSGIERRMLQMFYVTVWGKAIDENETKGPPLCLIRPQRVGRQTPAKA